MSTPAANRTGVRWSPSGDIAHSYAYVPSNRHRTGDRLVAWMVIMLLFACATVALYDTYLLLSGIGHG